MLGSCATQLAPDDAMRPLILVLLFVGAAAAAPASAAESERSARIAATAPRVAGIFRAWAEANHVPGLAWGVVAEGRLVYSGAVGHADLEGRRPVAADTAFRIASMSKSFTALAVLQLRDAGVLDLDAPASTWLPELAELEPLTSDAPAITVRHLLVHGAGFPEDNPWGDRQLDATERELRALVVAGISRSRVPGVAYEYSNLGYALLGRIVARASGQPFPRYMAEHVFEPLGMTATTYEFRDVPAERLALGYGWRDGEWFPEPLLHDGVFGAMGGLLSSVEDFARYAALHAGAWPPRDGSDAGVLERSSLREMHRPWNFAALDPDAKGPEGTPCPRARAYGYGLRWTVDCRDRRAVGHSGGLPGFGSNWTLLPDHDLAVVSLGNRTYASTAAVNGKVLEAIVAQAGLEARAVPVSDVLRRRRDALVPVLRRFDEARSSELFAENFFLDTPFEVRREAVREAVEALGDIVELGPLRAENCLRGRFVIEGRDRDLEVFFTLSPEPDPRIQALRLRLLEG